MPPPPNGAAHGKVNFKAMNKNVLKRLLQYLDAYRWQLILVVICIAKRNQLCVEGSFGSSKLSIYEKKL